MQKLNFTIKVLKNHFLNNDANTKKKTSEAIDIIDKAYAYYMHEVTTIINGSNKDASFMHRIKDLAEHVINTL